MQILSTRSKVSLRRFYESFTYNKQCESYVGNAFVSDKGCWNLKLSVASFEESLCTLCKYTWKLIEIKGNPFNKIKDKF
jgi:hypothetical protein